MKEESFTRKQMENAVMLAADLYQRMYNSPETDGGAQAVAGAIIDEACRMESWLVGKYGDDDDQYLDRLEEYEGMMVEKYELKDEPKQTVWVVTFLNDCEWELPNVSVNVFGTLEEARKCLDEEWKTLTASEGYDEDVSKKNDDDFLFEDHCANRTIGEIKEKEVK